MPAPTRTVTLHVVGAVEDDGVLVGRLATTLRIIPLTDRLIVLVGDPVPDSCAIIGRSGGALAGVVGALMAQAKVPARTG